MVWALLERSQRYSKSKAMVLRKLHHSPPGDVLSLCSLRQVVQHVAEDQISTSAFGQFPLACAGPLRCLLNHAITRSRFILMWRCANRRCHNISPGSLPIAGRATSSSDIAMFSWLRTSGSWRASLLEGGKSSTYQ
jgi:hypothetical protein